jgi:hypothetical protein
MIEPQPRAAINLRIFTKFFLRASSMKRSVILLILLLAIALPANAAGQKKRRNGAKSKPETKSTTTPAAPAVMARVRYKSGRELFGRIVEINLKSITIDAGQGNIITTSLQEVASLNIGELPPKVDAQFVTDADNAYRALLALAQATEGITYQEYQPKVSQAKATVESFISKYERSGPGDLFRIMRQAVRGFEIVSPIWSLRVGIEQHKYVYDNSEQMRPVLEIFPGIRQVAWKQNDRYPIEKVIAWLWVQSGQLVEQSRQQLVRLR